MKRIYDVFISYRRKDGQDIAEKLYRYLSSKGLRVFFDLEKMESGQYFPDQLKNGISGAPHYILIATPGAFNFAENSESGKKDYVLEEMRIACKKYEADRTNRTFHVINVPEIEYIEEQKLPEDIRGVSYPTWLTIEYGIDNSDIFEKVFNEITTVSHMNMWYGASRWYEESRKMGGRFEHLDICDKILPRASENKDKHIELPVNVKFKSGEKDKTMPLMHALKESKDHLYLIGQGGIGKTTSLLKIMTEAYEKKSYSPNAQIPIFVELSFAPDTYGALYERGKSSFIRRSVFRQIRNDNTLNSVNEKQIRAIDEVFTLPADVAVDPVTDILSMSTPAPEYLLLLDGLNEVSTAEIDDIGNVRHMITKEIELLVNECPNVRVVITSRSDENALNSEKIQKFYLSETDEKSIRTYLIQKGKSTAEIESALSDENLKETLSTPLFLTMYAELSETENVNTQGEIMRMFFNERRKNIYTAQDRLEKVENDVIENSENRSTKRITSQMQSFFLDFVLPEIAWNLERNNEFYLDDEEIEDIIYPIFEPIYEDERFSKYHICGKYGRKCFGKYNSDSAFDGTDETAEAITGLEHNFRKVTKRFLDSCNLSMGILQKTNGKYGFIHQHIRDYFAAVKNINAIRIAVCCSENGDKELGLDCLGYMAGIPFSVNICRFIGEALHEYSNRPKYIDGTAHYNVPNEPCDRNLLGRALNMFRSRFDGKDGYSVYNLVLSMSEGRKKELCGENLSNLDLRHCSFGGINLGDQKCGANLSGALINQNNILPTGHTSQIKSIAYSPDGQFIVSTSDDGTVKIWDNQTYELIKILDKNNNRPVDCIYSPDGMYIVSASSFIHIWDSHTYEQLMTLYVHGEIHSIAFNPDGRFIAIGSDNIIEIWDSHTYQLVKTLEGHTGMVSSIIYSPDGNCIVSASHDNMIKIWNSQTYELVKTLEGHTDAINSVAFKSDGKYIFSASNDNTIKIWDAYTYQIVKTLEETSMVESVICSPNGRFIASASKDHTIKIWESHTFDLVKTLEKNYWVESIVFSPDGKFIIGAANDSIKIWDLKTYTLIKSIDGYSNSVESASYSPDSQYIVSTSHDDTIKFWDSKTYKLAKELKGFPAFPTDISFSPDERNLVIVSPLNKTAKIFNSHTYELVKSFENIKSVKYSPDRKHIIITSFDNTVRILDSSTYRIVKTIDRNLSTIFDASYSPDCRHIIITTLNNVSIFDACTYKLIKKIDGFSDIINDVTYSPDGKYIIIELIGSVEILDSRTYKANKSFSKILNSVNSVVFSPDGRFIASISDDFFVKIWNTHTFQLVKTLEYYDNIGETICSISYSPDGKYIAIASSEGTVKIWDTEKYECVATTQNIPGLFVMDCNMTNLHPNSDISENARKTLKIYGAEIETTD